MKHIGLLMDGKINRTYDDTTKYLNTKKIHLDEYEGQERLRDACLHKISYRLSLSDNFFWNWFYCYDFLRNNFSPIVEFKNEELIKEVLETKHINNICKALVIIATSGISLENKKDTYFYNRWLRRN